MITAAEQQNQSSGKFKHLPKAVVKGKNGYSKSYFGISCLVNNQRILCHLGLTLRRRA